MLRSPMRAWVCGTLPASGPTGTQGTATGLVADPFEEGGLMTLLVGHYTVLTATVSMVVADTPIPTGTVSFYAIPPGYWTRMSGATTELLGSVALSAGLTASISVTKEWGDWNFYAVYNGDSKWAGSRGDWWRGFVGWAQPLTVNFPSQLPANFFGVGGWLSGTWGTIDIGGTILGGPWDAYAWGTANSLYSPAHGSAILVLNDYPPAPTTWELRMGEECIGFGLSYGYDNFHVGLSPIGSYGPFGITAA